ncbi:MAG: hypothetical protein JJ897_13920 [Marinibacterium sp.]|nr:hypothetical protein [Marinibacterium sp.]
MKFTASKSPNSNFSGVIVLPERSSITKSEPFWFMLPGTRSVNELIKVTSDGSIFSLSFLA